MLEAHTVRSVERWVGHPSIPRRVFGPPKYIVDLPKQSLKFQVTARPPHIVGSGSNPAGQQPPSQMGSFEATRSQHGGRDLKSKEQGIDVKFIAWFNTTFAVLNPQLKQNATLASQEATTAVLMEA